MTMPTECCSEVPQDVQTMQNAPRDRCTGPVVLTFKEALCPESAADEILIRVQSVDSIGLKIPWTVSALLLLGAVAAVGVLTSHILRTRRGREVMATLATDRAVYQWVGFHRVAISDKLTS